ncbi:MAG: serine hydrolase [Clostridiaceae bacterium]|nr:serine hydrolase [Clostridiaceae bacterium]
MDIKKIKELFNKATKEDYFSGVAMIKQGEKVVFSYNTGYAHRGFLIENSLETRFDTASITKLFTSVAIFQLIDKGLLSLNDKVLDILDIGDTKISKEVTIYHLLTHTSGIGDDADEEAGEDYEEIWKDKPNYSVRNLEDYLPNFIHKEPNFEPGKGCRYNNCAYILLGLVIEKITGKEYREYVKENIFEKIGMKDTEFLSMDGINRNTAEGYTPIEDGDDIIGWRKNIYSYPPIGAGDAGAYVTVNDLDKFFRELVNNKLLSEKLTKEILNFKELYRENDERKLYMGYGFEHIVRKKDNKVLCIKKDGSNAGVANIVNYYPDIDTTFSILCNNDACDIWDLSFEVQQIILEEV